MSRPKKIHLNIFLTRGILHLGGVFVTIGQNIKRLRKSAGLTQEQLAAKSGVATVTIRQYEGEKRQPRVEQLRRIADALNAEWTDLVPESDRPNFSAQEYTGLSYTTFTKLHEQMNFDLAYNAVDRHELDALISSPHFNSLLGCLSDYRTCCNFVRFSPKKAMDATTLEEANRNWKDAFVHAKRKGDYYREAIRTLELILKDIEQQCNGGDNNAVNEKKDD